MSLGACVVAGNTFFSFPFFFFFLLFSPYPSLPRARCVRIQKRRCNRCSMRFGFIGSRPLHLVPFSSFPFTHICSPVFFPVLLSSCLGASFLLSFAHTSVPALVLLTQVSACPGLIMRWGSLFVPVHLVPFRRDRVHFCPVLSSFHVFILLSVLRAHPWSHRDPVGLCFCSRGRSKCKGLCPTKLPCIWEARSDQPGVPAFENRSMAKAVQYVVSAPRPAAVQGWRIDDLPRIFQELWRPSQALYSPWLLRFFTYSGMRQPLSNQYAKSQVCTPGVQRLPFGKVSSLLSLQHGSGAGLQSST